ncbi:MAG: DsbE family thiol:disulfide interchange protein [Gammaproteobacteria bacterium]
MGRYALPLGIFALLAILLGMGLALDPKRIPSPLIDKAAPDFVLPQLQDPQKTLAKSDLRGQAVLINVWASWCVSCRQEHPLLMELARSQRAALYGFNYKDGRDDALRWLAFYGNPYRASVSDENGKVGIDFGVYGVPETFVVDKQGVIRYKHIGPITQEDLDKTILPLVERLAAQTR